MTLLEPSWLGVWLPVLCLVAIGLLQLAYFFVFTGWKVPFVVVTLVLHTAAVFGFAVWVGAAFTVWTNKLFLFAALYAALLTLLALPVSFFITRKTISFTGFYYFAASTDVVLLTTLVFTLLRLQNVTPTQTLMTMAGVLIPVVFIVCMVILYFVVPDAFLLPQKKFQPVADTLPDGNGKKIKVVLLTGQSNASGSTRCVFLQKTAPEKYPLYRQGFRNVWIHYYNDNGYWLSKGFVNAKLGQGGRKGFFGPELGMAEVFAEKRPDEDIYIIKYAWGGSTMHTQWLSPSSAKAEGRKTGDLYTAFITFTRQTLEYLEKKGYQPEVIANCWMQGEGDAFPKQADFYKKRTETYVKDTVFDLAKYIPDGKMVFVDAAISDSKLDNGKYIWPEYVKINAVKKELASEMGGIYLDTVAEKLSCDTEPNGEYHTPKQVDHAHYDSLSAVKLGRMFGEAVLSILREKA